MFHKEEEIKVNIIVDSCGDAGVKTGKAIKSFFVKLAKVVVKGFYIYVIGFFVFVAGFCSGIFKKHPQTN